MASFAVDVPLKMSSVAEVMARYPSVGAQVVDSPHCGAMHWHTARPDVVQCERQDAARYWHHQSLP